MQLRWTLARRVCRQLERWKLLFYGYLTPAGDPWRVAPLFMINNNLLLAPTILILISCCVLFTCDTLTSVRYGAAQLGGSRWAWLKGGDVVESREGKGEVGLRESMALGSPALVVSLEAVAVWWRRIKYKSVQLAKSSTWQVQKIK